jgi:hypothetical protein
LRHLAREWHFKIISKSGAVCQLQLYKTKFYKVLKQNFFVPSSFFLNNVERVYVVRERIFNTYYNEGKLLLLLTFSSYRLISGLTGSKLLKTGCYGPVVGK